MKNHCCFLYLLVCDIIIICDYNEDIGDESDTLYWVLKHNAKCIQFFGFPLGTRKPINDKLSETTKAHVHSISIKPFCKVLHEIKYELCLPS